MLTGCCRDPSFTGETSRSRCSEWEPKGKAKCYFSSSLSSKAPMPDDLPDLSEPLNVYQLIDIALRNNPSTKQSWADARAAAFNFRAQKSDLYPSFELDQSLSYTKQDSGLGSASTSSKSSIGGISFSGDGSGGSQYFNTLITDFIGSYLLIDFGERCANIDVARQALYASNWTHNRELQTVIFDVITAYYNQLNAVASYLASLRSLEDAETAFDSAEQMLEVGVKNVADMLQARSNYAGSKLEVSNAKGNLMVSRGKLARALGLPADVEVEVDLLPEDLNIESISEGVEDLIAAAKEHRPDLGAVHAQMMQKEAELRSAQSAGMPTITANVDLEDDHYINKNKLDGYIYNGAFALNVPIFTGFYYTNKIRQARSELRAACANLRIHEYDVLLQVLEAYYDNQTAVENYYYSKDFLESSTENYDVALENYKNGTGSILDVLNALKDLAQARSQFVQSRTKWLTSLANIAYSTGTIGATGANALPYEKLRNVNP
ncbi:MAG: TolC family protein [Chlamydiota bacterium]|nr:TolC family protein [Chlamydiota bacterium]